jgi:hypothetical protein
MHDSNDIDYSVPGNKPNIITFYNATKCGVDVFEEKCALYNTARSRRWPLTIVCALLNIAGVNGHIIYEANNNTKIKSNMFLKQFVLKLVDENLKRHLHAQKVRHTAKKCIQKVFKTKSEEKPATSQERSSGKCNICDRKKNNKIAYQCHTCKIFIFGEHSVRYCQLCTEDDVPEDSASK